MAGTTCICMPASEAAEPGRFAVSLTDIGPFLSSPADVLVPARTAARVADLARPHPAHTQVGPIDAFATGPRHRHPGPKDSFEAKAGPALRR